MNKNKVIRAREGEVVNIPGTSIPQPEGWNTWSTDEKNTWLSNYLNQTTPPAGASTTEPGVASNADIQAMISKITAEGSMPPIPSMSLPGSVLGGVPMPGVAGAPTLSAQQEDQLANLALAAMNALTKGDEPNYIAMHNEMAKITPYYRDVPIVQAILGAGQELMVSDLFGTDASSADNALGYAQLAQSEKAQKENLAVSLMVEKLQEESVNRTGERSLSIDLLADMMNRTTAQRLAAKDYVDTLMTVAERAPMAGQVYRAGAEPGGAMDVLNRIAGITGEFPREIGTAQIPVGMLNQPVPTTEEELARSGGLARNMLAGQGIGPGGELSAFPTVEDVYAAAGTAKGGKVVRAQEGRTVTAADGTIYYLDANGRVTGRYNPNRADVSNAGAPVVSGTDQDILDFLRRQVAAETALNERQIDIDEAVARGYFPGGAPTAAMQTAKMDYERALEVARINAGSASAAAAAEVAAANLYAEAQRYAADQGLKGAEVSAAAQRYVADVGAKTAAERLSFEKVSTQATLGTNPRRIFESLFLGRGLQSPGSVTAAQNTIPTNVMGMADGSKVVDGPALLLTGDRKPRKGDKWDVSEYVLASPGTVVAKRPKGEPPTTRNAIRAIMAQVEESQAGTTVKPKVTQQQQDPWRAYFLNAAKPPRRMAGGGVTTNWTETRYHRTPVNLGPTAAPAGGGGGGAPGGGRDLGYWAPGGAGGVTEGSYGGGGGPVLGLIGQAPANVAGMLNLNPAGQSYADRFLASPEGQMIAAINRRKYGAGPGGVIDPMTKYLYGSFQRREALGFPAPTGQELSQNIYQQGAQGTAQKRLRLMTNGGYDPDGNKVGPEYFIQRYGGSMDEYNAITTPEEKNTYLRWIAAGKPSPHPVPTKSGAVVKMQGGGTTVPPWVAWANDQGGAASTDWLTDPTLDIPTDVLPPEMLETPAFTGGVLSSLYRPRPIRGAFGETKEQLGERFNPLASNYYNMAKMSGTEQQAYAGLLSMLGMEPADYFEASKVATAKTFGAPVASASPLVGRRFAGSLLG